MPDSSSGPVSGVNGYRSSFLRRRSSPAVDDQPGRVTRPADRFSAVRAWRTSMDLTRRMHYSPVPACRRDGPRPAASFRHARPSCDRRREPEKTPPLSAGRRDTHSRKPPSPPRRQAAHRRRIRPRGRSVPARRPAKDSCVCRVPRAAGRRRGTGQEHQPKVDRTLRVRKPRRHTERP
jgi:hypothetical protein